ncbi:MAG: MiaB/RimO family radical SAM methylthiotransferase [Candidatus Omnitrophica bacterium]|nr:MiaB/RimO family radical SAM methylthiotransferase [Candidatus Omnitrophota bacterium]
MNDRDSEALVGIFLDKGYILTEDINQADVILVNTCSVRKHAEDRAISFLGSIRKVIESRSPKNNSLLPIVGLIGCMARSRGEEIFKKMPHVNLICSSAMLYKVPEYAEKILKGYKERIIDLEDSKREEWFYHSHFRFDKNHAYVVISTGCSNYCSYCVVPYVRGELRLRDPQDIIEEVKRNISLGIKKITLLGQNVNDYHYLYGDNYSGVRIFAGEETKNKNIFSFIDLLKELDKIDGIEEIDFITSHPKNTSRDLFYLMANSEKIKKHLHLPFQSGSDRILKLMNRGYTKEKYISLVEDFKMIVKGTLSTDVIVGFPTETEEDFLHTKDILEKVKFKYAYIFKYSLRQNTEAAKLEDDVSKDEKERRHRILLELQKRLSLSI